MAPKLQPGQSACQQAQRGIVSMLGSVRSALNAEAPLQARQVHDARTRIKRIRALLALMRHELGSIRTRGEDRALQAAGRALGPLREAGARLDAFDELSAHTEAAPEEARALLVQDADRSLLLASTQQALREADALLAGTELRVAAWPSATRQLKTLVCGFQRSYAAAGRAYRAAKQNPTPQTLHKLRRRTKRYQYQLQFVEPAHATRLHRRRRHAEALSKLLGRHHDLVLLGAALADPIGNLNPLTSRRLRRAVARRAQQLGRRALSLARRVYEKRPSAAARQLRSRLQCWQARSVL